MKRLLISALFVLAGLSAALGQSSIFPATLPGNTVVGRATAQAGPATAVPIATLTASILYGETPVADANYTVVAADRTIAYGTLTAARTVTLLSAASYSPGAYINILDRSGNASTTNKISIAPTGADTINGVNAATAAVQVPYSGARLETDGVSKWTLILGSNIGTVTNDNAPAGAIGEFISSSVVLASAVALTTATPANVTSVSLTAGDWDCAASLVRNLAATTSITMLKSSISTVTAADGNLATGTMDQYATAAQVPVQNVSRAVGPTRLSLAATTTVFLVADDTFTVSTNAGYGILRCRRAR